MIWAAFLRGGRGVIFLRWLRLDLVPWLVIVNEINGILRFRQP
jgi:hypothetical protein